MNLNFISIFVKKVEPNIGLFFLLSSILRWIWRYFKWLIRKLVKLWLWACLIMLVAEWSGNVGTDDTKSTIVYPDNSKNIYMLEGKKIEPSAWTKANSTKEWTPAKWAPKEN